MRPESLVIGVVVTPRGIEGGLIRLIDVRHG
jgi:hypothetical protein